MAFKIMDAVAVSSTNTYTSLPVTSHTDTIHSFQVIWTGNPAGDLTLEVSNDGSTWSTTAETFDAEPAGSASNTAQVWSGFGYKMSRIKYVNSSGSGTMTIYATVKK